MNENDAFDNDNDDNSSGNRSNSDSNIDNVNDCLYYVNKNTDTTTLQVILIKKKIR